VKTLSTGVSTKDGANPVARSNVCPDIESAGGTRLSRLRLHDRRGECVTVLRDRRQWRGYPKEWGTTATISSVAAISVPRVCAAKARWVLGEMERRMAAFGMRWQQTTAVQLYTIHDVYPFLRDELVRRGAAATA